MNRKRLMRGMLAAAAAGALLAGCGSSSDDTEGPTVAPTTPSPPAVTDAFLDVVRVTIASSPDDAEAASIDNIAATTPEDNEPVAP
jgi:ABC-type glycerol-3-phosphate transport system substrate-binding protein